MSARTRIVCVCGSRSFADRARVLAVLDEVDRVTPVRAIWSGGARGADALGEAWAALRCRGWRRFVPDWDRHGNAAGVRRSAEMVAALPADAIVVAFVPGFLAECRGTRFTVEQAVKRGLPVVLCDASGTRRLVPESLLF